MGPSPSRIGRFEIVDRLGGGGMGVLYLARDPILERTVAIKVLSVSSAELRERFSREARSAARLKHPNIVTVYDVGDDDGNPFIAMEYVDGETLAEVIRRRPVLALGRKVQILLELCQGLAYAHRQGIIHRDIKPANVMITSDGVVKILDFGLARLSADEGQTELTRTGVMLGTPHYMSPEQIHGHPADERSDIFAVGLVMYELLAYRKAYPGDTPHAIMYRIVNVPPPPIHELCEDLDPQVGQIVETAIHKSVTERYQTLTAMVVQLEQVLNRLGEPGDLGLRRPGRVLDSRRSGQSEPPAPSDAELQRTNSQRLRDQENSRAVRSAVERGRLNFKEGAFEAAARAASEALAYDAENDEAIGLKQQAIAAIEERQRQQRHDQAALDAVAAAKRYAAGGDLESALHRLRAFTPSHPLVEQAAVELADQIAVLERQHREEADRQHREEADRQHREEADRQHREEADRQRRDEADRQRREEAELQRREEADRQRREEVERQRRDEVERQRRDEADRQRREEAERQRREEAERQHREEAERQRRAEESRLRRAQEEQERRILADRSQPAEVDPVPPIGAPVPDRQTEINEPLFVPRTRGDSRPVQTAPIRTQTSDTRESLDTTIYVRTFPQTTRRRMVAPLVGLALCLTMIAGGWWAWTHRAAAGSGAPEQQSPALVSHAVNVNAVPWATVRIVAVGRAADVIERTTPFSIALPEGEYRFELRNPSFKTVEQKVVVGAGQAAPVMVVMPGADVDRIVSDVLGVP